MTLAHGYPWTPEIWQDGHFRFFVAQMPVAALRIKNILERQVESMSRRNGKAGRSWQKQAAGYPFRDTSVQKANDQYWKNCTTIRTVNFTHRARRGA